MGVACVEVSPAVGEMFHDQVLFRVKACCRAEKISHLIIRSRIFSSDFSALCGNNRNDMTVGLTADILAPGSLKVQFFCSPYVSVRIFYSRPFVMCDYQENAAFYPNNLCLKMIP